MENNGNGKKFNAPSDSLKFYTDQPALFSALESGEVQVIFVDESYANSLPDNVCQHGDLVEGWSGGVSFACHPSLHGVVEKLNQGLTAWKNDRATLCGAYPGIPCDCD